MKKDREFPTSLFLIGVSLTMLIINLIVNMEEEKAMYSNYCSNYYRPYNLQ